MVMGGRKQRYTVQEHLSVALALAEDDEQKRHINEAIDMLEGVTGQR